jgi:uncharacterized phage-like protein YoqJ
VEIIKEQTVCFTGHRPEKLGGYSSMHPLAVAVKEQLRQIIVTLIEQGFHTFISGMAIGVDQWAAEIVIELKRIHQHIKLVAAVPFEGQEKMWHRETVEKWQSLIDQADEVVYVCEPGYTAWKMQKRNIWMVDHSSVVVAVWDGSSGGTANCTKYAISKDKQIILIEPYKLIPS